MTKRTPGPWQVVSGNVYGNNMRSLIPANGADARLVAAAPDLLEAIEGLLDALPSATTHPAIRAARAAIARATGEQQ